MIAAIVVGVGMRAQRLAEPSVGEVVAAHHAAQQRHDASDVEAEEPVQRAARRREIETSEPAARLEHASEFTESGGQVSHVAQHEAVDDAIESVVTKRKPGGVAGDEVDTAAAVAKAARAGSAGSRSLGHRGSQHVGAEIRADHAARSLARQFEREIAGAGCDVERHGAGRPRNRGRLAPPSPVESHRHQPVDEVVAGHDAREHRAHEGGLACGAVGAAGQGRARAGRGRVRGGTIIGDGRRRICHGGHACRGLGAGDARRLAARVPGAEAPDVKVGN